MSDPFVGEIRITGFNFAPVDWALCDGQLLPISQNAALFSLLGTQFGGDGRTTFALPNLQGCVPIGQGDGPGLGEYVVGESGGASSVTLEVSNLPSHTHSVKCNSSANPTTNATSPSGCIPATVRDGQFGIYTQQAPNNFMNGGMLAPVGGEPVSIVQPILCLNFVIALEGIFPARQ